MTKKTTNEGYVDTADEDIYYWIGEGGGVEELTEESFLDRVSSLIKANEQWDAATGENEIGN